MKKKTKEKLTKRLIEILKEELIKIENSKIKSTLFVMYISYIVLVSIFNPYNLVLIIIEYLIMVFVVFYIVIRFNNREFFNSKYKTKSKNTFFDTFFDTGILGEFYTFNELEKIDKNNKILVNLYIPKENKKNEFSEIDILMIDKTGIYVFESKNISGWVFGSQKDEYWTIMLKKDYKVKMYNPIIQNNYHIKYLKEFLKEENLNYNYFKSYIIFSDRCTIKKMNIYSKNLNIMQRSKLYETLQRNIKSSKEILTDEQIKQIYNKLLKYSIKDENIKSEHINKIKGKYYKNKVD